VILAANEGIGFECLKALLEESWEVAGVVTGSRPGRRPLENRRLRSLAARASLPVFEFPDINAGHALATLEALEPALIFNVAYLHLYKRQLLALPSRGCINFHPGPLPRYGGSNGWVWAIINQEERYGVALHVMKERIDTGEIVASESFPIDAAETGVSLLIKCYTRGAELFRGLLRQLGEGGLKPLPQDLSQRSYYLDKIPHQGLVDPAWSARKVSAFVRALTFSPFSNPLSPPLLRFGGRDLVVSRATIVGQDGARNPKPGQVVAIEAHQVVMGTGAGLVRLRLADTELPGVQTAEVCRALGISEGSVLGPNSERDRGAVRGEVVPE